MFQKAIFRMRGALVISLGGSAFVKETIDTAFLEKFAGIIRQKSKTSKVFIYVGGGKTARNYQEALAKFGATEEARDRIGIYATRLNAQLLKLVLGKEAEETIIEDPTKPIKTKKNIILAGGWKPGWSTDYDAILLAENVKANTVVNLTNVDYVYDKDPRTDPNAKSFEKLTWPQYKKIIGGEWTPGLHTPFDPIAAKEAERAKLKVIILNGSNLENFELYLNGKKFKGTVIG
jgi:uridylate kinase